jgi:hypothetical protein
VHPRRLSQWTPTGSTCRSGTAFGTDSVTRLKTWRPQGLAAGTALAARPPDWVAGSQSPRHVPVLAIPDTCSLAAESGPSSADSWRGPQHPVGRPIRGDAGSVTPREDRLTRLCAEVSLAHFAGDTKRRDQLVALGLGDLGRCRWGFRHWGSTVDELAAGDDAFRAEPVPDATPGCMMPMGERLGRSAWWLFMMSWSSAAQAGLAASWHLHQRDVEHVVLERSRVGERWRSERWDSLSFQFPNWALRLPGWRYDGRDPDGFASANEIAALLDTDAEPLRSVL